MAEKTKKLSFLTKFLFGKNSKSKSNASDATSQQQQAQDDDSVSIQGSIDNSGKSGDKGKEKKKMSIFGKSKKRSENDENKENMDDNISITSAEPIEGDRGKVFHKNAHPPKDNYTNKMSNTQLEYEEHKMDIESESVSKSKPIIGHKLAIPDVKHVSLKKVKEPPSEVKLPEHASQPPQSKAPMVNLRKVQPPQNQVSHSTFDEKSQDGLDFQAIRSGLKSSRPQVDNVKKEEPDVNHKFGQIALKQTANRQKLIDKESEEKYLSRKSETIRPFSDGSSYPAPLLRKNTTLTQDTLNTSVSTIDITSPLDPQAIQNQREAAKVLRRQSLLREQSSLTIDSNISGVSEQSNFKPQGRPAINKKISQPPPPQQNFKTIVEEENENDSVHSDITMGSQTKQTRPQRRTSAADVRTAHSALRNKALQQQDSLQSTRAEVVSPAATKLMSLQQDTKPVPDTVKKERKSRTRTKSVDDDDEIIVDEDEKKREEARKAEAAKWVIKPKQSLKRQDSKISRLFYSVDEAAPITEPINENNDEIVELKDGTLAADLIKLIEETNAKQQQQKQSKQNTKPSMLIDTSALNKKTTEQDEEPVGEIRSRTQSTDMDEEEYFKLIAELPGIDPNVTEYWELKKDGVAIVGRANEGAKAAAKLISKVKKMNQGQSPAGRASMVRFADEKPNEDSEKKNQEKLNQNVSRLLHNMVPLRIGKDDEWRKRTADVKRTSLKLGIDITKEFDMQTALNMEQNDDDDESMNGYSVTSSSVKGSARPPRFRDRVWARAAAYMKLSFSTNDPELVDLKEKTEKLGLDLIQNQFGPYSSRERWEGLETLHSKVMTNAIKPPPGTPLRPKNVGDTSPKRSASEVFGKLYT